MHPQKSEFLYSTLQSNEQCFGAPLRSALASPQHKPKFKNLLVNTASIYIFVLKKHCIYLHMGAATLASLRKLFRFRDPVPELSMAGRSGLQCCISVSDPIMFTT
jgi:hypothetical protein